MLEGDVGRWWKVMICMYITLLMNRYRYTEQADIRITTI